MDGKSVGPLSVACFLPKSTTTSSSNDRSLLALTQTQTIQCQHCKLLYIGETGRTLKTRITEHVNNIKKGHTYMVLYTHFTTHGIQTFKYIGLEHNPLWSKNQRIRRESQIIISLAMVTLGGLNERT